MKRKPSSSEGNDERPAKRRKNSSDEAPLKAKSGSRFRIDVGKVRKGTKQRKKGPR